MWLVKHHQTWRKQALTKGIRATLFAHIGCGVGKIIVWLWYCCGKWRGKIFDTFYIQQITDPAHYQYPYQWSLNTGLWWSYVFSSSSLLSNGQIIRLVGAKKSGIYCLIIIGLLIYWSVRFAGKAVPTDAASLQDTADVIKGF